MKKVILSLLLSISFYTANAQKVAIIGAKHLNSTEDGVSILALDNLAVGQIYYFTDNNYNNTSSQFVYELDGGGSPIKESVVKITVTTAIPKGSVIYFKESAPSSSNVFTASVTPSSGAVTAVHVGSSGSYSLGKFGESMYVYTDNNEDPADGVTEIHGAFFAGTLTSTNLSGGPMPASENPSPDFANAIVVHNFPQQNYTVSPYDDGLNRVEYKTSVLDRTDVTKVDLENSSNYVIFGSDQDLSTTKFTNFNLVGLKPVVILTRNSSQLNENSSSNFTYTFEVDVAPTSNLVVNFSVNGSSANGIANFGTDYTQTGATSMNSTSGTVTISSGTTSKTIVINPTGDSVLEPDETLQLSITSGSEYTAGSPSVASSIIKNDDVLTVVPDVAITGTRHYTDNEDGVSEFSFTALKGLLAGASYVFSSNPFNKSTLLFSNVSTYPSELKWTVPTGGIARGDVIVVKKTAHNTFTVTRNGSATSAGTVIKLSPSKNFYISQYEGFFRAHTDTDNNPYNGITAVHSQIFTYSSPNFGGNMPASLDLSTLYAGSVLVDGFANTSPQRLEYKPTLRPATTVDQAGFENPANWLYAEAMQELSSVPFNNIIVSEGSANPKATVTISSASILEDSETSVYTLSLDATATSDITINFSVAGTATFPSDYTVSGANSYTSSVGSITIPNGASSAQLTINPVTDATLEKTEDILISITSGIGYDGGSTGNASVNILNDDANNATSKLAIIGINHLSPASMSLVAMDNIPANSTFYFLRNQFDKSSLTFESGGKYKLVTPNTCILKGTVLTITGGLNGPLTVNCNNTSDLPECGTATIIGSGNVFDFLDIGTRYHVYEDNDEDQTNGITQIHAVFNTGGTYPSNHTGGFLTPEENPKSVYSNAVVVDGFPAVAPNRTEFDASKRNINISSSAVEDISNYLHAQSNATLSFTNFNAQNIIYVDSAVVGGLADGTSWTNAYSDIQSVLETFESDCANYKVWVAKGTYYPTSGSDQSISFELKNNLAIYGGFEGTETALSQRNITNYPTILSGDLGTINDNSDNSYHVVKSENILQTAILDGFIVKNGNAQTAATITSGGGILGLNSKAIIQNCTVESNSAVSGAGIFLSSASSSKIINCIFKNNAALTDGGGVAGSNNSCSFTNCLFVNNTAATNGGAIHSSNSNMAFVNSTFTKNNATVGDAVYVDGTSPTITNSIFWNNLNTSASDIYPTSGLNVSYSIIENGYTGTGNLNQNPLFINADNNFGLQAISVAIDAGLNTAIPDGINEDLIGSDRLIGCFLDMGAYEYINLDYNPLLVSTTNDNGCGSLRFAVENAFSGDTIRFSPTIDGDTIKLTTGHILIDKNLVIIGNDISSTIIDGQINSNIFRIKTAKSVIMEGIRIQNGIAHGESGGGIINYGNLVFRNSKIINCQANVSGGGIFNTGNLQVLRSTISGNKTDITGGGVFHFRGSLVLKQSSITGNIAYEGGGSSGLIGGGLHLQNSNVSIESCVISGNRAREGGGIYADNGFNLKNSIVAGNYSDFGPDISTFNVSGLTSAYSLIGSDEGNGVQNGVNGNLVGTTSAPLSAEFVSNVPSTTTTSSTILGDLRLQACSPAINAALADTIGLNLGNKDLAGNPRVFENRLDIGAYEYQSILPNPLLVYNTKDDGCGSLRYVVANAISGDTIRFDNVIDMDSVKLTSGQILINKNLVILGNGMENTIIDGQANDRVFEVLISKNVKLIGVTIQNGMATASSTKGENGGGIYTEGNLTIESCQILNNKVSSTGYSLGGGGISSWHGTLNINKSKIIGNENISTGSYATGGGLHINTSSNRITNTVFSGNVVNSTGEAKGGGIAFINTTLRISNCTVSGNSAIKGGGIYQSDNDALMVINNTLVANNIALTASDDILNEASIGLLSGSNNFVKDPSGNHNFTFGNNVDPQFVVNVSGSPSSNGNLRLQYCSAAINSGNPSTAGLSLGDEDLDGNPRVFDGLIDIGAYEIQTISTLDPLLVTNTNNDGCGSLRLVIQTASAGDTIRFDNVIDGDTIKLTSGQLLIDKDLVIIGNGKDNTIIDGQANDRIFEISSTKNIFIKGLSIQNGKAKIVGNQSKGGGIYNSGHLSLIEVALTNNAVPATTQGSGGAIYSTAGSLILKSVHVRGNSIGNQAYIGYGGAILIKNCQTEITNSIISGNKSGNGSGNGSGGAIYIYESDVKIYNSTISGNEASTGGGIAVFYNANVDLRNSIVAQNKSFTSGNDIYIINNNPSVFSGEYNLINEVVGNHTLTNTLNVNPFFVENVSSAPSNLGDFRLQFCSEAINAGTADTTGHNLGLVDIAGNTRVYNNRIDIGAFELQSVPVFEPLLVINTNDYGCGSLRLAVENAAAGDTIRFDNIIDGDTIKLTTGQILIDKDLVIIGNGIEITTIDGQANDRVFEIGLGKTVYIQKLSIQNGGGTAKGGGLYNSGSLYLRSVAILNNHVASAASCWGGGIYNNGTPAFLSIVNCKISGNRSEALYGSLAYGGGIYNVLGELIIKNSLISGNLVGSTNSTSSYGGGINNRLGTLTVYNSTITGNQAVNREDPSATWAEGGGIFMNGGTTNLTNTIVSKNDADDLLGNDVYIYDGTFTDNGGNLVFDPDGGHNISNGNNLDPLFVQNVPTAPSTEGNLRLQPCSPAINAGKLDTLGFGLGLLDLDGNVRVFEDRIDVGAYEFQEKQLVFRNPTAAEFNNIYACENGSLKLSSGISSSTFTYQWQLSTGGTFTDLNETAPYSQVTNDSLSINPSSVSLDGYQYRAMISNGCKTIISDTITLKVGATPMITLQPVSQIVCPNNEAILEVDVNGAGVSFQWQIDNGSGFVNVSGSEYFGANSKRLIISNFDYAKSGKAFRCLVFTACFQIPSDAATITINTDVTILAQPMSQTVCEFSTAIFTAQAVKLSAGTLTYQWQRKSGVGVWTNINTGGRYTVNGNQLSIANAPASWNGAEFRCLMNDYCQTIPKTLNVIPVAHVTQNPVNQEICIGNNANFSITAAGEGLTYRWQVNSGSGFTDLTDGGVYQGATSANLSLSFPSADVNNYQYRCVVSGTSSCDMVADTSAVASISIGVSAEAQTVVYNSPISTNDGVTQAVGYIVGINDITAPNGKAEYRAGNAILLNPGFEVESGAVFSAKIMNPCQVLSTSSVIESSVPKEKVK